MRCRFSKLAILTIGLVALLLASCTAISTTPATSGTPSAATSASGTTVIKPEGSLKVGAEFIGGGNLDPQTASPGAFANLSLPAIFDTILIASADGSIQPGIAERWEIAPDGMTQTLYIRQGVKFHDGTDLTGADVKFSIERLIAKEATASPSPTWRAAIASVELKDDYTVVIRMKARQYLPLAFLEHNTAAVMPKKYIEEKGADVFRKNPIGSGPWKAVRNEPGARLELEAVEGHWRAKPQFKNITILHVAEEATKVAMLKTGEIDMAQVAIDSVPGLKSAGLKILSYDAGSQAVATLWFDGQNPDKYAFGDIRVRKALQWSINAQEMIDNLLSGNGAKIYLAAVSPKAWFFDQSRMKLDPYDPEGAKKLLAEAGYANGFPIKMWDHGGFQSTVTLAVAGYWRKLGITADIAPIESGAYTSLYVPNVKPELYNTVRIGTVTGEDVGWDRMVTFYHSTKGRFKNLNNARLNELIDIIPNTADAAERTRLGGEAAFLAQQEYSTLRIMDFNAIAAYNSKIGGMSAWRSPFGLSGFQLETITRSK